MADLISDLAAKAGVSPDLAAKGVGAILALLKDKLPAGSFSQLQSAIPNASNLMAAAQVPQESSGGILEAVSGAVSKLVGGDAGALASRFTQLGFSGDQLNNFLPGVLEFLKSKLPADVVKQASALLPGVGTES
jgi:Protein of unknown function VcgC/VcgE (DUF2780)